MKQDDFAYLAHMLRRRSGLLLGQPKTEFIESRLAPVMRRFGFRDTGSLIAELRHGRDALARAVTEAMTTNESSFFRDRPSSSCSARRCCRSFSRAAPRRSVCASGAPPAPPGRKPIPSP